MKDEFNNKYTSSKYAWDDAMILDKVQEILEGKNIDDLEFTEEMIIAPKYCPLTIIGTAKSTNPLWHLYIYASLILADSTPPLESHFSHKAEYSFISLTIQQNFVQLLWLVIGLPL